MEDDSIPTTYISKDELPIPLPELLVRTGLCKSKSEARRLIKQGGAYICRHGEWVRVMEEEDDK